MARTKGEPEGRYTLTEDRRDRAVGALLGLAVGDAIGTTLEFKRRDAQPPVTDMIGGGPFGLRPGQWTDDTAMALCLADSILASGGLDQHDLMARFVRWWRHGENSCTGACFDIGITTSDALARFEQTGDPVAGSTHPRSAGNGSLMRLAPVAIRWHADPTGAQSAAREQSVTTHGAPAAVEACALYAQMLVEAIQGQPKEPVLVSRHWPDDSDVGRVASGSWRGRQRPDVSSSGYVIHTLEAALWAVDQAAGFREAVLIAANLADDADTVAAVAGQLAGGLWGASGIPVEWRTRVAWSGRIGDVAAALYEAGTAA